MKGKMELNNKKEKKFMNFNLLSNDLDLTKVYFDDIVKNPLLTKEEEVQLAKRIAKGDEEARNKLIESNLRLVVSIAKQYTLEVELMDLVQEGTFGLMKAVEKYDPDKGYRFSTYATYWIREAITRSLASKFKTIKIPLNKSPKINKLIKLQDQYYTLNGKEISVEELANQMNLSIKEVEELLLIHYLHYNLISLDAPCKESYANDPIIEFVQDDTIEEVDNLLMKKLSINKQNQMIDSMVYYYKNIDFTFDEVNIKPRDLMIFKLNNQIDDEETINWKRANGLDDEVSLAAIGRVFDISRERARQINDEVKKKIRKKIEYKVIKGNTKETL